jgi:hypothetical protein
VLGVASFAIKQLIFIKMKPNQTCMLILSLSSRSFIEAKHLILFDMGWRGAICILT